MAEAAIRSHLSSDAVRLSDLRLRNVGNRRSMKI